MKMKNEKGFFSNRRNKVISINQTQLVRMIISKPTTYLSKQKKYVNV